ncbi:MAG: helix-turn-helix domain-containing protein [Myxococcota bacterium]|nr:helix-turn-helix domain-containing protein [Myxococcota bacterium]
MEALIDIEGATKLRRIDGAKSAADEASSELTAMNSLLAASGCPQSPLDLRRWLELAETWYITRTLGAVRGNRSEAARALGIGRRTLYAKMKKLGIEASWQIRA